MNEKNSKKAKLKRQKEVDRIAKEMSSWVNRTKKVFYSPIYKLNSLVIYQDPYTTIHRVGEHNLQAYTPLWVYYYSQRKRSIRSWEEYDLLYNNTLSL